MIASIALPLGGWIGVYRPPSQRVTAALLAFASGALITAVAFELFEEAFEQGGAWTAGVAFLAGASVFIVLDTALDRYTRRRQAAGLGVGLALLAGVTLDGIPENVALGVGLTENSEPTLLVAIFTSNLPEAVVGARKMREAGLAPRTIVLIWAATGALLAVAVVAGYSAFEGLSDRALGLAARLRRRRGPRVARGHADARGVRGGRRTANDRLRDGARVPALVPRLRRVGPPVVAGL